jgi:hypothetical protein
LTNPQVFELPELAKILGLDLAKVKNWTNGRTGLLIEPSIRKATGTGTRNLYSLEDLHLMAVANEFSKAGYAAMAIGKLVQVVKPLLAKPIAPNAVWTIWRVKPGGSFSIELGRIQPPKAVLWNVLEIGVLSRKIDEAAKAFVQDRR